MSARQFADGAIGREGRGKKPISEIFFQTLAVRGGIEVGVQQQGVDFGCEGEQVSLASIKQRLLAERVAGQEQTPAAAVENGEGEHSV